MHRDTYGIRIIVKSDNDWYKVIGYVQKKMIYSHVYPSTYDVRVQILLPKHVLVHIPDENNNIILLAYSLSCRAINPTLHLP